MGEKTKYGYKHDDGHYSKMTGNNTNSAYSIYDKNPAIKDHAGIHININTDTGKGSIVEHGADGKSSTTNTSCYLTSACMKHFQDKFDDNCYELTVLRWFRDNFVSNEDINHYYEIAPIIVESINSEEKSDIVYNYIYDNVVDYCILQIEQGNYDKAYNRYKNSILLLEEQFAKPFLQQRLIKTLKKSII